MAKILRTTLAPTTRTGDRNRNATVRTLTQYGYGPMEGIKARPTLRDPNGVGDFIEKMVGKAWKEGKAPSLKVEEDMGRTSEGKRWKPQDRQKRRLQEKTTVHEMTKYSHRNRRTAEVKNAEVEAELTK